MKNKAKLANRILSIALSIAVCLQLCLGLLPGGAQARVSLPNIERLKQQQGGAFRILELLPDGTKGSLGYYIAGQEPCANWAQQAALENNAKNKMERANYINGIFKELQSEKLLGAADSGAEAAPLTLNEAYTEVYPWEEHGGSYSSLSLDHVEAVNSVTGSFTETRDGAYEFSGTYKLVANGATHVQVMDYFSTTPEGEAEKYFWYAPKFAPVDDGAEVTVGTAVYKNTETFDNTDATPLYTSYVYAGTVGSADFTGMEFGRKYYTVTEAGEPAKERGSGTDEGAKIYAAVGGTFRAAESGETPHFQLEISEYSYVGSGGDYSFSSNGTNSYTIKTKTVFYKGGFTNNNWFYRYVFDWEPEKNEEKPKINLIVESVTAKSATIQQVNSADMLVLSNGSAGYAAENDLAANTLGSVYEKIIELCKPTGTDAVARPVLVDVALTTTDALNINKLARELTGGKTTVFAKGNVYCADYPIATVDFNKSFSESQYKAPEAPFYEVFRQIVYENQIRGGKVKPLPLNVSIASCIRHIIAGNRVVNVKSSIKVLEIEPGKTSGLTQSSIRTWLGDQKVEVSITTLSTSELIGKIEDIAEGYDLIYIGSNISNFNTKQQNNETVTDYFDNDMDGLLYSSIGDKVIAGGESGWSLSGLLDRDYADKQYEVNGKNYNTIKVGHTGAYNNESRTFRYSGNDLTEKKLQELLDYANEGHPVIFANDITNKITMEQTEVVGLEQYRFLGKWDCIYRVKLTTDPISFSLVADIEMVPSGYGRVNDSHVVEADCQWYIIKNGTESLIGTSSISESRNAKLSLADNKYDGSKVFCKIAVKKIESNVLGNPYTDLNTVHVGKSNTAVINFEPNTDRVDNCSHMYKLLQGIYKMPNVKSAWQLEENEENQKYMRDCVNLSKPTIEFVGLDKDHLIFPTPYKRDDIDGISSLAPKPDGSYSLEYAFKIESETDATPLQTRYTAKLYIDANADGSYTDNEQLNDIIVRKYTSSTGTVGERVDPTQLELDTQYILTRKLPVDKIGIIPWKLAVEKTGTSAVRNSVHGYTHVKPKPEQKVTLDVLQINTSRTLSSWFGSTSESQGLNLQANIEGNGTFAGLFKQISDDYEVNIITVKANTLDDLVSHYKKYIEDTTMAVEAADNAKLVGYLRNLKNNDGTPLECQDLPQLLSTFDMLIMGFDDCYQELSITSAQAIASFIDSGKATLFSHDNTSFFFLPFLNYRTENEGSGWIRDFVYTSGNSGTFNEWLNKYSAFGYNFNMTIRDKVGLDRYGVTNKTYGLSKFSHPDMENSGIVVSSDYLKLDSAKRDGLINAGYDIAYKPKSGQWKDGALTGFQTVPETQGLTEGVLIRYYQSGGRPTNGTYKGTEWYESNFFETLNTITQVNEGQITTYPFNINTKAFGGTLDKNIPISKTHFQYQQLNMNADDVVVWYCLSGGTMDYTPNDAVNSYYIYNRGNVTYTGFGHTTYPVEITEAKLLVNTIIAAYRTAQTAPVVRFTNETGTVDMDSYLMPTDGDEVIHLSESADKNRRIFFTVYDTNIGEKKKMSAQFGYENGDAIEPLADLQIFDAQSNALMAKDKSLVSGVTYYVKLDDILTLLERKPKYSEIIDNLRLIATVSSDMTQGQLKGSAALTLRKLKLFNLS